MSNFLKNIHPLLRRGRDNYDDTNFAVLNALNFELTDMERETIASKIQSSLKTATGDYLDKWGDWFGVYRKEGETDEKYRARIIKYLLLKRGTIPAIIDAIKDFLEDNDAIISIYEPWKNIFYTNNSKLNGEDHLMGFYYRFAIIDISIDRPFPPEIMDVIQAFKPAGVLFYVNYDGSLNPLNKPWIYPVADIKAGNKTEYDFYNGVVDNLNGNLSMADKDGKDEDTDIFHTNNSDLNGADVLAGSFSHNRNYTNMASKSEYYTFKPEVNTTLTDVKLATEELDGSFYMLTREEDKQFATATIKGKGNENLVSDSGGTGNYPSLNGFSQKVWDIAVSRVDEGFTRITTQGIEIPYYFAGVYNANSNPKPDYFGEGKLIEPKKTYTATVTLRMPVEITDGMYLSFYQFINGVVSTTNSVKVKTAGEHKLKLTTTISSTTTHVLLGIRGDKKLNPNEYFDFKDMKLEIGTVASIWSPRPTDFPDKRLATYQYYTYDLAKYVDNNFKKEYKSLTDKGLSAKEAYVELIKAPTVTTVMKSLVSPTNKASYTLEVFDFSTSSWHIVYTGGLGNTWDKQNIDIQSIIDYISGGNLLFTRIGFDSKKDNYDINVDVINLGFHNRFGKAYTITQKMYVYPSVTTGGTLSNVKHNFYSTAITGDYTGSIDQGKLYIDGKFISQGGDFANGKFTYYVRSDLVKRDSIVVMEGWSKTDGIMLNKASVTLINNTINFLTNSSYKYSSSFWALTGVTGYTENDTEFTDSRVLAVQRTGGTGSARAFVTHPLRNLPDKAQPLTFSGYYWVDSTVPLDSASEFFIRASKDGAFIADVLKVPIATNTPVDKWQYFEVTTNSIPDYDNLTCCFALTNNGKVKMRRLKVEQGVNAYPWTPTQTVVLKSDFNTPPKVSNSMVENKNDFRYGLSVSTILQPPNAVWGEGEQVHMDGIKKLDGTVASLTRLGVGNIGQWLTKYDAIWIIESNLPTLFAGTTTLAQKVQIAKTNISKFHFSIWARGSSPTDLRATHSLFNPFSQAWTGATSTTGTAIALREIISNNASTPAYLNPDGMYYFNSYATPSDGVTGSSINIDYSRMEITLATPC